MVKIQVSQMLVAKLTTRYSSQAYLGVAIIDYGNEALSILWMIGDRKEVAYIISIGQGEYLLREFIIFWLLWEIL